MIFTSNEKSAIVAVLSSIMKADGVVAPNEQSYMNNIYERLGINIDDFKRVVQMNVDDCKQIFQNMTDEKKAFVDKCFLDMVGVDGHVDLRELRVLHDLS